MKKKKVSVIIPVYKPDEEILNLVKKKLNEQTIKPEIIEKWNNPEAVSMNLGIREAKGEFIIILAQDCVPANNFWIEKMIRPLENEKISAVVSDLILLEEYWKKRPFFVKMFTIPDLKLRKPAMNLSSCAYRKKDLEKIGYINEKISAIDVDFNIKIKKIGGIERGNVITYHLHPHKEYKKMLKTFYNYAKFNGLAVKENGIKEHAFFMKILRAIPIFGLISIYFRYPFKKYFYLFPIHFFTAGIIDHAISVIGFWNGLLFAKENGERNKEVLKKI